MDTQILKTNIPSESQVRSCFSKIDFEDAYAFVIKGNSESIEEIYIKIFSTTPKWVEYALRLRNFLVAPFGLKTDMEKLDKKSIQEGEKFGIFKIYKILPNEIIAGENDRHLDFRVSVFKNDQKNTTITISTIVQYRNQFGKIYMNIISPFHKMVVKSMIKSSLKRFNVA